MESSLTFGRLVRNLLLLALLGFVAVLFAKPLLTAAAVLLALALVGFLLWLPLHSLVLGRQAPLRPGIDCGRAASARVLAGLGAGCRKVAWLRRRLREKAADWATLLGPVLVEVVCGAVLGGMLVWAYENPRPESESLAVGALAGAVIGALVVWMRRRPVEEA